MSALTVSFIFFAFFREENWFYKRFQQTFQNGRINYCLYISQVLLTGAILGPEINSLCKFMMRLFTCPIRPRVLGLIWEKTWFIHKIIQIWTNIALLFNFDGLSYATNRLYPKNLCIFWKLQLGQSSRSKKLSRLFLGHFWAKIRSDNCFEIVFTYRMA